MAEHKVRRMEGSPADGQSPLYNGEDMDYREIIGNVVLNTEDYPGRDLYSDGEIEDVLLDIAMNTDPADFDRVVEERKNWPVMYHFSSIRTNIMSWMPITKDMKVLEIGSGCGAITGTIAQKAGSVTCVELSRKRSLINAYRNREKDNIEIRLGNFEDVEKKLDTDYDMITLIGVFEYAQGYISSADPYHDFLSIILRHLKPGGQLVMAIENRLGMKYFAGATEDHSGQYFEGMEGYSDTSRARTFAKPELEEILSGCGLSDYTFYYPYPDYKFPMSVYSDYYLPKRGELRTNLANFDRERLILFDETQAFDSLVDSGLFPLFANSFLVVARGGKA